MPPRTCAWHCCSGRFYPTHAHQVFCSRDCQKKRGVWKAKRGAPLVDLLLKNDAAGLVAARESIAKEIKENTP